MRKKSAPDLQEQIALDCNAIVARLRGPLEQRLRECEGAKAAEIQLTVRFEVEANGAPTVRVSGKLHKLPGVEREPVTCEWRGNQLAIPGVLARFDRPPGKAH